MSTELTPTTNEKNVINYNPVFPVMFADVKLDLPIEDMAQDILSLAVDTENYDGGYTTFFNRQNIEHIRGYKQLMEAIYGVVLAYTREMKYEVNADKCSIHAWASVMRKGGFHGVHNHPRSQFSGTFYIKCDETTSPIVFHNPTEPFRMHDPLVGRPEDFTPFTSPTMSVQPKENTMMIWPSWVNHHVEKMHVGGPRIAISFNVDFLPPGV
jgi:uncharacterized protein (TIGR02466 family)